MCYSPIVLFVYNRPWHTLQTIEALKQNLFALESDLIIYSDAPKNKTDQLQVEEVRSYIRQIAGFKSVDVIERETNWGLANSIIDGVTHIINKYGKIIVLEDDIVTSPYFLKFMNDALTFYEREKTVWHISGWNYPIKTEGLEDTFLWRVMNCWGWATWADRWKYFERNVDKTFMEFSAVDINRLNLDGHNDSWSQLVANKDGRLNTWAIFWYTTIFRHNGLCLNPAKSFVKNIGLDGSGQNCGIQNVSNGGLCIGYPIIFTKSLLESKIHVDKIKKYLKSNSHKNLVFLFAEVFRRILSSIQRLFG